jgi:hypothetical protein
VPEALFACPRIELKVARPRGPIPFARSKPDSARILAHLDIGVVSGFAAHFRNPSIDYPELARPPYELQILMSRVVEVVAIEES